MRMVGVVMFSKTLQDDIQFLSVSVSVCLSATLHALQCCRSSGRGQAEVGWGGGRGVRMAGNKILLLPVPSQSTVGRYVVTSE